MQIFIFKWYHTFSLWFAVWIALRVQDCSSPMFLPPLCTFLLRLNHRGLSHCGWWMFSSFFVIFSPFRFLSFSDPFFNHTNAPPQNTVQLARKQNREDISKETKFKGTYRKKYIETLPRKHWGRNSNTCSNTWTDSEIPVESTYRFLRDIRMSESVLHSVLEANSMSGSAVMDAIRNAARWVVSYA